MGRRHAGPRLRPLRSGYRLRLCLRAALRESDHDLRLFTRRPRFVGPAVLPDLRPAAARAVLTARAIVPALLQKAHDNDRHWLDSNHSVLRHHRRAGQTARLVHDARLQRRAHLPVADPAPGRGRIVLDRRRRREARAALADLHCRHAAVPCRRLPDHLCGDAAAGPVAVQPGGTIGGRRGSFLQYRDLASSPTPTGRTTAAKARCPISCRCWA